MSRKKAMLTNLINTLSSSNKLAIINCNNTKVSLLPFQYNKKSRSKVGSVYCRKTTILEEKDHTRYSLLIAIPPEVAENKYFVSILDKPEESMLDDIRQEFPETSASMTNQDLFSAMNKKHQRIWEQSGFKYENPVFFSIIEKLGGVEFIKKNAQEIIEVAGSMLSHEESEFKDLNVSKINPNSDISRKMLKAFNEIH